MKNIINPNFVMVYMYMLYTYSHCYKVSIKKHIMLMPLNILNIIPVILATSHIVNQPKYKNPLGKGALQLPHIKGNDTLTHK